MACTVNVVNSGGSNDGKWFIIGAPSFPVTLGIALVPGDPLVFASYDDDDPLSVANDNDIDVRVPNIAGTYVFQYSPTGVLSDCLEDCVTCATYTIINVAGPADIAPVEVCKGDVAGNLFTDAGLSCNTYSIDYAPGSDEDADFNTGGTCGVNLGDYLPTNITVGTYYFRFTRIGTEDCDDCFVDMEFSVVNGPFAGTSYEEVACITS